MKSDDVSKMIGVAVIAALARHRVQPRCRQRWKTLQRLADERQIRINLGWTRTALRCRDTRLPQDAPHRVVMHMQLPCDRADAPFFSKIIPENLRFQILGNAHGYRSLLVLRAEERRRKGACRTNGLHQRRQNEQRTASPVSRRPLAATRSVAFSSTGSHDCAEDDPTGVSACASVALVGITTYTGTGGE